MLRDKEKLRESIIKKTKEIRNLGEHARKGSDHLSYRSIIYFKIKKIKKVKGQEKECFEVTCKYKVYTLTEFTHPPEMDEFFTEHYLDKFILDEEYKILDVKKIK